jgi:hypothetical protein
VHASAPDPYTDKKEYKIFLIYKEIQMGSGAKSYMRKGFLIYEEMRKYFPIYEDAISHIVRNSIFSIKFKEFKEFKVILGSH